jgi:hypothetical protein
MDNEENKSNPVENLSLGELMTLVFNRLDAIDKKLNNHIVHIATDITTIQNDIKWICLLRKEKGTPDITESKEDIKTHTDVAWLKKFFWLVVGTFVSGIASIIVGIIMLFIKK